MYNLFFIQITDVIKRTTNVKNENDIWIAEFDVLVVISVLVLDGVVGVVVGVVVEVVVGVVFGVVVGIVVGFVVRVVVGVVVIGCGMGVPGNRGQFHGSS